MNAWTDRPADRRAPRGPEPRRADHLSRILDLLGGEDEPLVLLTHLLRWCRDDHRVLWEHVQQNPHADPQHETHSVRWPAAGQSSRVDRPVRESMAAALQNAGTHPPVSIARALAVMIDVSYGHSFNDSFRTRSPYQPGVGDPIPLDGLDLRAVTRMTPTSPRWRLANRLDETRHVRLAGEWAVQYRVVFDYSASTVLAGMLSRDTIVATCHPNSGLDELDLGERDAPWLFPVGPHDPHHQAQVVDELIRLACAHGASIIVLPELATTKAGAAAVESWVRRDDGPDLIVTGSYHEVVTGSAGEPGRRVNTALTWLRGHEQPLVHHKHSPGDRPRPEGIQPQGWPELRVYVGDDGVHLVVAVCRDLLNPSAVHALTEVGANVVLVPAMSETLTPFVGAAANLVISAQALVAVSNNPAAWTTEHNATVSSPARGLFGHPGFGALTRLVQSFDSEPGVSLLRVSSGQLTWVSAVDARDDQAVTTAESVPGPAWMRRIVVGVNQARTGHQAPPTTGPPRAAVLVLLSARGDDLCVLLTRRASDLAAFPGAIAFPGGHLEPSDAGVVEAAVREAQEEIGLDPDSIDVIGVMAPMYAESVNLVVHPVLAWRRSAQGAWSLNRAEIEALADVPLHELTRTASARPAVTFPGEQDSSIDLRAPIGDLTRAILDRLVAGALREGALTERGRP